MEPADVSRPPDVLFRNGRVLTVNADFAIEQALLVRGETIIAVGDDDQVTRRALPDARVIDLDGRALLPGINDAHLHLATWAISRPPFQVDLDVGSVSCLSDVRRAVAGQVATVEPGGWAVGRGWHAAHIAELSTGDAPRRTHLDVVSGDVPIFLWHRSLHAAWVNTRALELAGITAETPDPPGGTIVRDPDSGEPTGHLLEGAVHLVAALIPEPTDAQWQRAIVLGMHELNRRGVTSVTDPMVAPPMLRHYLAVREAGAQTLRLGMLLHWTPPGPANSIATLEAALAKVGTVCGLGDPWLSVSGAKLFADGIPPLRSSWMYKPFTGGGCGGLVTAGDDEAFQLAQLRGMIELLHRSRWRVGVHVTGDRGCAAVAEAILDALAADPWPKARHHLIHASLLSADLAARLAAADVTVSTNSLIKWQSTDLLTDAFDESTNGYHYPWRSLVDAGVHVADASDAPVTDPDWRQGMQTLVTRRARGSGLVSGQEECLTREEALRAWTYEGAYQDRQEQLKGSLEAGKAADLVVLASDPMTVETEELPGIDVDLTMVGGRVVYERS